MTRLADAAGQPAWTGEVMGLVALGIFCVFAGYVLVQRWRTRHRNDRREPRP